MFETTVAGSLPKPLWLAEPEKLWPAWKLEGDALAAGKIDATILAVKRQEDAGIDIVSDGEQARIHFVHGFLANLDGIDFARRQTIGIRADRYKAEVPTVTGPIRRKGPVHKLEADAARAHTRRKLKFTLPGPMTIADTIANEHYSDRPALAHAFAVALNEEARELEAIGVDVVQFDEPAFNVYMRDVKEWGVAALERAAQGLKCTTAVHICYGYGIKANNDWKATLGEHWRQYEETFPALAASRIDQVSLECRNARVPIELIGLLKGKTCWSAASMSRRMSSKRRRRSQTPSARRSTMSRPISSTLAPIAAWRRWRRKSPTPSSRRWRLAPSSPAKPCSSRPVIPSLKPLERWQRAVLARCKVRSSLSDRERDGCERANAALSERRPFARALTDDARGGHSVAKSAQFALWVPSSGNLPWRRSSALGCGA